MKFILLNLYHYLNNIAYETSKQDFPYMNYHSQEQFRITRQISFSYHQQGHGCMGNTNTSTKWKKYQSSLWGGVDPPRGEGGGGTTTKYIQNAAW